MKLRTAPTLEGARWVRSGFLLLLRQPLAHAALFGVMAFGLGLLLSLPWIGPVLALGLLPALNAGWVHSTESVLQNQTPTPLRLLEPLRSEQRSRLLLLGALQATAALLMFSLADLLDPNFREQWSLALSGKVDDELAAQAMQAVQQGLLLRAAMLLPVLLLFWHAPVIIHRTGAGVAKAIFVSALATLRNLGAFVVYGLTWFCADLLLSAIVSALLGLIGQSSFGIVIVVPASMLFSAAFFASLHASVHGCIDFSDPSDPPVQ